MFGIVFLFVVSFYFLIKGIDYLFNLIKPKKNLYVELHKNRELNNKQYEEYLIKLQESKSNDLPIDKIKPLKEVEIENKIKDLLG